MFRIGEKVICVDVNWEGEPNPLHTMPVKGSVYTIRGWEDLFDSVGVLLVEIVNPIFAEERYFAQGKYIEVHFANYHFRSFSTIDNEEYESCEEEYVLNNQGMNSSLKTEVIKILRLKNLIEFGRRFCPYGSEQYLFINDSENEDYIEFKELLEDWLYCGAFLDFCIQNALPNYDGYITLKNDNVCVSLTFDKKSYDDYDKIFFELNEEFCLNVLCLDLVQYEINNFEVENIFVFFEIKNSIVSDLSLNYAREDNNLEFELNEKQFSLFESYVLEYCENNVPYMGLEGNFDCKEIWTVTCEDNVLEYIIWSTPLELSWEDIDS